MKSSSGSSSGVKSMSLAKPKFGAKKAVEADEAGSFWDDAMASGGSSAGAGAGAGAAQGGVAVATLAKPSFGSKSPSRGATLKIPGASSGVGEGAGMEGAKKVSSMKLSGATKLKVDKSDGDGWDDW